MNSFQLILLIVFVTNIRTSIPKICVPLTNSKDSIRAYNIDRDLYIDVGNNKLIIYNLDSKQELKVSTISDVFGDAFQSVTTAYNLNYGECKGSQSDCETQSKAKQLVIVFGVLKSNPNVQSYMTLKKSENGSLLTTTTGDLIWKYKPSGVVNATKEINQKLYNMTYQSIVFIKEKSQLIMSGDYLKDGTVNNETAMKEILITGGTGDQAIIDSNLYTGMFAIDNRAFAINKENAVLEAKWDDNGKISFVKANEENAFFDCLNSIFGNEVEESPIIGIIVIIIIVVLILIIVIAIVFFVIKSRDKKSDQTSSGYNTNNNTEFNTPSDISIRSSMGQSKVGSKLSKKSKT